MLKSYNVDLHIHTLLSPCADILMTPGNIIKRAIDVGLDIIAITDHNSAENVEVAIKMARNKNLKVIPGMEVESSEGVHLLCLFDNLDQILKWQKIVYSNLPDLKNREDIFGYQLLTDTNDELVAKVDRLLATSTRLNIAEITEKVKEIGGIVIPSHVDRPYNSIISNLGFVPGELDYALLEISKKDLSLLNKRFSFLKNYGIIRNSDSHYLEEIKAYSKIKIKEINLQEILMAARKERGREIIL